MRRLNLRKQYVEKAFKVQKFFVRNRHNFDPGEILLLQTLKQEEGLVIKRMKGFMVFDKLLEDTGDDSERIYGRRWPFIIQPKKTVKFDMDARFNLSDILGPERGKKYDGQAEVIKLDEEDERAIMQRISKFLQPTP